SRFHHEAKTLDCDSLSIARDRLCTPLSTIFVDKKSQTRMCAPEMFLYLLALPNSRSQAKVGAVFLTGDRVCLPYSRRRAGRSTPSSPCRSSPLPSSSKDS